MKLSALLRDIVKISPDQNRPITGLSLDSRQVQSGDLFFARVGKDYDGRAFIDEAVQRGAAAILAETSAEVAAVDFPHQVPVIFIQDLNCQVAGIAARFYEYPAKSLQITGVTGTNGKTSCTHFIAAVLQRLGITSGIIGTLGRGTLGHLQPFSLTTPDAILLQKTFAEFVAQGIEHVAMEVSSHSLDQGRVAGVPFTVGVFTNLTRDHLDYHHNMEAYGAAKKKLFDNPLTRYSVVNADDVFGKALIESLKSRQDIFAYTINSGKAVSVPCVRAQAVSFSAGIQARVETPWGNGDLSVRLMGEFNLSNVLAVLATLCLLEIPLKDALLGLEQITPVVGRMQTWGGGEGPLIVVDYSHTPDALEKALLALRAHCQGRVYCVFGCGGDRDRGKRPLMAAVTERYADEVIVTDDNPRTENPARIVADILSGFSPNAIVRIEHDRSKAIRDSIQYAKKGDCVLIAGKGAETYQQIGDQKIEFSDIAQVEACLAGCRQ
jgi:UDP-N-acetylmuramoyl-L-alanyl-D-glutamate--2,6-diaminopimelate ligase